MIFKNRNGAKPGLVLRLALRFRASEFIRAAYVGILGRDPDDGGSDAYSRELQTSGRLAKILGDISSSPEALARNVAAHATALVRLVFRGLLHRDPTDEEIAIYAEQLKDQESLGAVVSRIVRTSEYWQGLLRARSAELLRTAWRAILGTEPDDHALEKYLIEGADFEDSLTRLGSSELLEGLIERHAEALVASAYRKLLSTVPDSQTQKRLAAQLRQTKDISALLAVIALAERPSVWLELNAEEFVQAAYQGLLSRQPDPELLKAEAAKLKDGKHLTEFMSELGRSQEHWDALLHARASDMVGEVYRGLLNRDPDPEGLTTYVPQFARDGDLASLIATVGGSEEHKATLGFAAPIRPDDFRRKVLLALAPELVRSAFRGLLSREPDPEAISSYTKRIREAGDLGPTLREIVRSKEFRETTAAARNGRDPAETYDVPTWVFMHIQKTAGTSLQSMLRDAFHEQSMFSITDDRLYMHAPADLSTYTVFAGHFNHDSLRYIPRRSLSLFTFVRDPKSRLLSLYYHWRSHEPTHPRYARGPSWANELSVLEFFGCRDVVDMFGFWNHMTWAIMGERQWREWRVLLEGVTPERATEILGSHIRPAVRRRLTEFVFVGLQEEFNRSVHLLFRCLNRPQPPLRESNITERLGSDGEHFKSHVPKEPITAEIDRALEDLVQIDKVVYEEAQALFTERWAECSMTDEQPRLYGTGT